MPRNPGRGLFDWSKYRLSPNLALPLPHAASSPKIEEHGRPSKTTGYREVSYSTYIRHNPPNPLKSERLRSPLSETRESATPAPLDNYADSFLDFGDDQDTGLAELQARDREPSDDGPEGWWDNNGADPEPDDYSEVDSDIDMGDEEDMDDTEEELARRANPNGILLSPPNHVWPHHELDHTTRHLYTSIAHGKAIGISVAVANSLLDSMTTTVELERGDVLDDRTAKVKTALSRLGVNPDDSIERFILCPNLTCWTSVPFKDLYVLASPACAECGTAIYRSTNNVRKPHKVIPYAKLSRFLLRLLRDESIRSRLNEWRIDEEDCVDQHLRPVTSALDPAYDIDTPLEGLSHGSAWRSVAKHTERVVWGDDFAVTEEPVAGEDPGRHVAQEHGLQIILNCDWFAVKGLIGSSVGAIYATVANLPRDIAFKRKNTALLCIIPGPKEPGPGCFAKVLEPIIKDFQQCERGLQLWKPDGSYGVISARLLLCASDLPAMKKMMGVVGHSHRLHPCHQCDITKEDINTDKAYKWRELEAFDPSILLQRTFEYERADAGRKEQIEEDYGVRFSPLMRLIGAEHAASSPVDPLHNSFLGISKAFVNMLFRNEIFPDDEDRDAFMAVFEKANYPGHLGRIPSRITKQFTSDRKLAGSGLKADQWKRIMQLLPIALFVALKNPDDDDIEDYDQEPVREETPAPQRGRGRRKAVPREVRRNAREWYRIAIMICSAMSTLHAHRISIREAMSAVDDLAGAATAILAIGESLTINWHIAMHYVDAVRRFGPLSGFGTYPFERNNGALAKVKHNGQERDVPTTLLRSWELEAGLASVIANPAPDASEIELAGLEALTNDKKLIEGTLMLNEARGVAANRTIRLPMPYERGKMVNLQQHGVAYETLLDYLHMNYPQLNVIDAGLYHVQDGFVLPHRSSGYTLYSHAVYNGFKFCSTLWSRSRRDAYALARMGENRRHLCRLHLILEINMRIQGVPLRTTLALLSFFRLAEGEYPWQTRQIDLGIRIYRDQSLLPCFLPLEDLQASTIVSKIRTEQDGDCLVSISCDRDGPEPEYWLAAEGNTEAEAMQAIAQEDEDDD